MTQKHIRDINVGALGGRGLDLVFNPNTGELEPVGSWGWYAAVNHDFTENVLSNVVVGANGVETKNFEPPETYKESL